MELERTIGSPGKVGMACAGLVLLLVLPIILPTFHVFFLAEILILGLFGMSVNLLVGYCGMVTLGQAAFFAVGGYTVAILTTKASIPFAWAFIIAPFVAGIFSLMIGYFCVRLSQFYFAMLTLAFGMLVWAIIYKWDRLTEGVNGIVGVPVPHLISSPEAFCWFTTIVFAICTFVIWLIVNSPFGYTMRSIRENPERAQFLGIKITFYKLTSFVLAGFFAGISGALFTAFTKGAFPDAAAWSKSGEGLIIALIGGLGALLGPLLGATVFLLLEQITTYVEYGSAALGVIMILIVLLMPDGVLGVGKRLRGMHLLRRQEAGLSASPDSAR